MSLADLEDLLPDLAGSDDQELRALIERAHLIAQLTQHPGWPLYSDYLISLSVGMQTRVLDGRCKDMTEYAKLTGRIEGLRVALQAPGKLDEQVRAIREQVEEEVES